MKNVSNRGTWEMVVAARPSLTMFVYILWTIHALRLTGHAFPGHLEPIFPAKRIE